MSKKVYVDFFWIAREQLERMEILLRHSASNATKSSLRNSVADPDPSDTVCFWASWIRIH